MRMKFRDYHQPPARWGQSFCNFAIPSKTDPDLFYETSDHIAKIKAQTSYPAEYHKYISMEEAKEVHSKKR